MTTMDTRHLPDRRPRISLTGADSPERWIREGWTMAGKEPDGVFESIAQRGEAEVSTANVHVEALKAQGRITLQRHEELQVALNADGFNPAAHLRERAQGRLDLVWAVALLVLNAILAVFVLLGFGPWYVTVPLALLVVVTALPIEEFFHAYEDRAALREGVFLTLGALALLAQFWLGSIRGLFVAALAPADVGPVTQALGLTGSLLQYGLGILAMVSECVCGYKLWRVRAQLHSATAQAVCERDRYSAYLVRLHAAIKGVQAEPEVRRHYREIGARQCLAQQARADQDAKRLHLRRAAIGALIALLAFAALLTLLAPTAFAAPAPGGRDVVVLLDLSKSTSPDSFHAHLDAITNLVGRLQGGNRLVVLGITDSFGQPQILLDRSLPQPGYLGLQLQAGRERLRAEWREIVGRLSPLFMHTDIVGTLALIPYLGELRMSSTYLVVLSDLRQSTDRLDLESVARIDVIKTLDKLKRTKAIPALKGAKVSLLGVESTGKTTEYFATLREFWLAFFAETGAEVLTFSVGRRVQEF